MFAVHTTPEQGNFMMLSVTSSFFEKLRFHIVFCPHENGKPSFSNSYGLKSVSEKFRFRDGLVWSIGLTVDGYR